MLRSKKALMASAVIMVALVSISSFAMSSAAAWTNEGPYRAVRDDYNFWIIGVPPNLDPAYAVAEVHLLGNGYVDPNYGDIYTTLNSAWFNFFVHNDISWGVMLLLGIPFPVWAGGDITYYSYTFTVRSNLRGVLYSTSGSYSYAWHGSRNFNQAPVFNLNLQLREVITASTTTHVTGTIYSNNPTFLALHAGTGGYDTFSWYTSASVTILGPQPRGGPF